MAHRYKLTQDFEQLDNMVFLKQGEIIEYMPDLHAYVKVRPYGVVQIPSSIVQRHPHMFELLPPEEKDEFTIPEVLDEYTYIDSRLNIQRRKYSNTHNEDELIANGNYFMGKMQVKDSSMASRILTMFLLAIKNKFARQIKEGDEYIYCPVFTQNVTSASKIYEDTFEDKMYRLIGNCFDLSSSGKDQAQLWGARYQPALYYFLQSKY